MATDWFRKERWSTDDEADFFAHLNRARPAKRAEYLRVQAVTLVERKPHVADQLAAKALAEHPHYVMRSALLSCRAHCALRMGRIEEALSFLELAIQEKETHPNVDVGAVREFAFVVTSYGLTAHYQKALTFIDKFPDQNAFPAAVFQIEASRAIIFASLGWPEKAGIAAQAALHAAGSGQSGFRYHPELGLVGERYSEMRLRLAQLIARKQ